MQKIDTLASLDAVADPSLRPILERYRDMMEMAAILIAEPTDTLAGVELARGGPLKAWEFIHRHQSGWYEVVIIADDWGCGDVILIPDRAGIDPALLTLCCDNAEWAVGSLD